jgi:hypothetical protein
VAQPTGGRRRGRILVVTTLPAEAVIAELPFGDPAWELRDVYYSSVHLRPLVNGYSGGFPASYHRADALLSGPTDRPEAAWRLLEEFGVTHVIVHEAGFAGRESETGAAWLLGKGATRMGHFGRDLLFAMPQ